MSTIYLCNLATIEFNLRKHKKADYANQKWINNFKNKTNHCLQEAKPNKIERELTCQARSRGAFYSFSWRQALALIDIFWFAYLHLCIGKFMQNLNSIYIALVNIIYKNKCV